MNHILICLLTLLFSLSGSAMGGYSDFSHSFLAAKTLSKGERHGIVYERLDGAPVATTAEGAMEQMNLTLNAVEDAFSVSASAQPLLKV